LAKENNLLEIETFYFGEGPNVSVFFLVDANKNGSLRKEKLNLGGSINGQWVSSPWSWG
jgi:hypothetical protein